MSAGSKAIVGLLGNNAATKSVVQALAAPLSETQYGPAGGATYTPNNVALTALDTVNLTTQPFTFPASGKVKITVGFLAVVSGAGVATGLAFGLLNHTGGTIVGPILAALQRGATSINSDAFQVQRTWIVTGAAGSTIQLDLAAYATGATTFTIQGQVSVGPAVTDAGPITMLVEAA